MLASLTIRLNPADDVVIARQQLIAGTILADEVRKVNVHVRLLVEVGFDTEHRNGGHAVSKPTSRGE